MSLDKKSTPPQNKNISIGGDVVDSTVIVGDNNTVNQTIIQKFFNIFKSDVETLEQRNRRILLTHVENAWIKGVLDASLYGAAMLDLGIKETPEAITNKYPWTLKKESTNETLSAGTSMLEIFDSIGMGRSLLILGAPGSGKTTMLLELARGLIARAREDITQPIPIVFNLASWTEKLTLTDWLAQELNNLYSVPRKTAPDWVRGNKLLLLLDGLDEVRQDSRAKCVEAINEFRKQNGLTSLAVCSRSQDYADIKAKLAFEGAIEVQPLTQGQIAEFFNRFGDEIAGIKQALEKDSALREMAETPLFLSIMLMAYRDKQDEEILVSGDEKARRKHLFDTYIECMFVRPEHSKNSRFKNHDVLHWLTWLAQKMIAYNTIPYLLENTQPKWLTYRQQWNYRLIVGLIGGIVYALAGGITLGLMAGPRPMLGLVGGLSFGLLIALITIFVSANRKDIKTVDILRINWIQIRMALIVSLICGLGCGLVFGWIWGAVAVLFFFFVSGFWSIDIKPIEQEVYPGQKIYYTIRNSLFMFFMGLIIFWLFGGLRFGMNYGLDLGFIYGAGYGLFVAISYGGFQAIQHYSLRFIIVRNGFLPVHLIPFLDHCVDLIFLRRVGGGYIFIHRLLMEHFAEMYIETPKSKGN